MKFCRDVEEVHLKIRENFQVHKLKDRYNIHSQSTVQLEKLRLEKTGFSKKPVVSDVEIHLFYPDSMRNTMPQPTLGSVTLDSTKRVSVFHPLTLTLRHRC